MGILRNWIPWRLIIRRAAKAHGFIDPVSLLARLRQFAQPSEIQEPIELLRAGIVFHARGLINAKAIQQNLDWIWPYWVEKQFNPSASSFIPRAFSISHINLTHRNWTAVGIADMDIYPIVDPRGLITPFYDGWSIDFWILGADGRMHIPSRNETAIQSLITTPNLEIVTTTQSDVGSLTTRVKLEREAGNAVLRISCDARAGDGDALVASIRPYNPEGIQFVEKIRTIRQQDAAGILVNGSDYVYFDQSPADCVLSTYTEGDVLHKLNDADHRHNVHCRVGMATSASIFPMAASTGERKINLHLPMETAASIPTPSSPRPDAAIAWTKAIDGTATLEIPDQKMQFLYNAAIHTLVLLSAKEIVPGPYTYKRFWYRDAALMMNALLVTGFEERCKSQLDTFPADQKNSGYFQSQEGEWDSNGQVLWIADRFQRLTNRPLADFWKPVIKKAVRWLDRKRITNEPKTLHAGLLPPGFSAEHLGPNDYYYWDNFWAISGLLGAARAMHRFGDTTEADKIAQLAADFKSALEKSMAGIPDKQKLGCIPASPYRRMDPGAIGSLVADYPLRLYPAEDPGIADAPVSGTTMLNTARFLMNNCFHDGGFFQDMIHSGINPYLTLSIAQTLLRHGDSRYRELISTVADLASPTGQWPEAIHPITKGGCMGDGQHGWAAAEWIMMMRNLFIREEDNTLILGSGVFPEWLNAGQPLWFGPTPTPYGAIGLRLTPDPEGLSLTVTIMDELPKDGPNRPACRMEARVPGFQRQTVTDFNSPVLLKPA